MIVSQSPAFSKIALAAVLCLFLLYLFADASRVSTSRFQHVQAAVPKHKSKDEPSQPSSSSAVRPEFQLASELAPPQHTIVPKPQLRPDQIPKLLGQGESQCLPDLDELLVAEASEWKESCREYGPYGGKMKSVATITVSYGDREDYVDQALKTHMIHSIVHKDELYVMCNPITEGMWNKQAFLLNVLYEQMLLPKKERQDWLLWADRDTVVVDHCRPTSTFLPPVWPESEVEDLRRRRLYRHVKRNGNDASEGPLKEEKEHDEEEITEPKADEFQGEGEEEHKKEDGNDNDEDDEEANLPPKPPIASPNDIHMLGTKDVNGLNAGVFLLRVHPWSITFLENVLAYRFYNPTVDLRFSEQSAMAKVLRNPDFRNHIEYVPWHWFNAYPNSDEEHGPAGFVENETDEGLEEFQVRRGDFMIHFAGNWEKEAPMTEWLNATRREGNVWRSGRALRKTDEEIKEFWAKRYP